MRLYPFDTQRCRVDIIIKGTDRNLVNLRNGTLKFLGPSVISQYIIKEIYITENLVSSTPTQTLPLNHAACTLQPNADPIITPPTSVSLVLVLGRKMLSVVLTSFVPTISLVLVNTQ